MVFDAPHNDAADHASSIKASSIPVTLFCSPSNVDIILANSHSNSNHEQDCVAASISLSDQERLARRHMSLEHYLYL